MTTVVKMPQLGESIAEGTIGRWLKQVGEAVQRDEPLVEVQTDKVNAEIPSPAAGYVQQILQPEGATVKVQTEIALIGEEPVGPEPAGGAPPARGQPSDAPPTAQPTGAAAPPVGAARPGRAEPPPEPLEGPTSSAHVEAASAGNGAGSGGSGSEMKRFYTPVVLRMAQEHGIDLGSVQGSGLGGRVTRRDVERAVAARSAAPERPSAAPTAARPDAAATEVPAAPIAATGRTPAEAAGAAGAAPHHEAAAGGAEGTLRPLTPMRRAIAAHMARARTEIPDAWSMVEVDVTRLVRQRAALQADWQAREGYELTYLPFFVKAVIAGLRAVPELNATWEGERIRLHQRYHLGIAVAVENGLVVPVLRDADQSSVAGLARALRELVQRARTGRLAAEDLQGGTFTVNNPGALGSILSQPIVPVGQAGIVTMEAVVKRPMVTAEDAIAVRSMMNSCLSFDHRILDGAQALRFLRVLREQLESVEYPLY